MKIAIVVPGGVDRGGVERVIPALLALIGRVARIHETHVFALAQEPRPGRWLLRGAVVHNTGRPATGPRTVTSILREHGRGAFDVVHAFWIVPAGMAAAFAAGTIRRPFLLHAAGGELVDLPAIRYGGSRSVRGRIFVKRVLRSAHRVTAASGPMMAALARLGITAERVPLGVALDEWPPAAPRRRDPGRPARLVHVASLNAVKDQTTLILAVARLAAGGANVALDIVGGDTTGGALRALAEREGVAGRIRFHGFLTHARTREVVVAADLFLLSSRHDAGPVAVLEA
ncbi:MAG: glycosyltransferase family 4 protein, partial [Longimicrobiales bacterium]